MRKYTAEIRKDDVVIHCGSKEVASIYFKGMINTLEIEAVNKNQAENIAKKMLGAKKQFRLFKV